MRKWLLLTTALVVFDAAPAQAAPLITAVTGFLTTTFGATIGGALAKLGASFLMSAASRALLGSSEPKQQQQRGELAAPTALPPYRFAYGQCWAPGTPVGWQVVGNILYICYLLNSRPSALTLHEVLFDKRGVEATGNAFDFTLSGGAVATNSPFGGYAKYWIGRGNQTGAPAQIVAEASDFAATDAWQGCTVLWARLDVGPNSSRSTRWPKTPPDLNVNGDWSLVYDPRDGLTKHSRNQALIVLDAMLNSPAKPHAATHLRMDTFAWGADVADQAVAAKGGGTIPRYACDGILVWATGTELEDQLQPLLDAGAARLSRIGGKVAFIPAIARDPVYTVTEFTDGQPVSFERWQPGDGLYTEAEASYTNPARGYETASAPTYVVPGAQAEDGGPPNRLTFGLDFVVDHRQAQRLAKIAALRSRMQRTIAGELWPDAFNLVAGSICTVSLPSPLTSRNGSYVVEEINPSAAVNDNQSIMLRLPARLREESPAIYAWDAETEEQDVADDELSPFLTEVQPPASVTVVSGSAAAIVSGGTVTARIRATWPASVSGSVTGYEWQIKRGAGAYSEGASVDVSAGAAGTYIAHYAPVVIGDTYTLRVRTVGVYGQSDWIEGTPVVASGPTVVLASPAILSATPSAGQVILSLDQADDPAVSLIEVWRSTVNDVGLASLIDTINAGANVTVSWTNTGLASGTYYYWPRAADAFGNVSGFGAVAPATVP